MTQPPSIRIEPRGGAAFRLTASQWLPRPRDEVFAFFSRPENLNALTPPWLHFRILTPDVPMAAGARIDYVIRLHGLPLRWRTEIRDWAPPHRFVDRQLRGPYRHWEHLHTFAGEAGGTRVLDQVDYRVPVGAWVHRWFVEPDVRRIFAYRQETLARLFPA